MKRVVAVMMFLVVIGFAHSSNPRDLLYQAKQELAAPGQPKIQKIIPRLQQANDLWAKASSDDPAYAESIDLLALLLRHKLGDHNIAQWQTEAAPLVHRALEIRESHSETSPDDLALALELAADTNESGREGGGAPYWRRATAIRADNVAAIGPRKGSSAEGGAIERVGGQVNAPQLLSKVEPEYTLFARMGAIQGVSAISLVIDSNGIPGRFKLAGGCGYGLDEKAVEALRQWEFRPGTKDGQPVNTYAMIKVSFRIKQGQFLNSK